MGIFWTKLRITMQRQMKTVSIKLSRHALILWSADIQSLSIFSLMSHLYMRCHFHNDMSVLTELSAGLAVWVHVCFQVYSAGRRCR